jgi:hypothetical protein
MLEVLGLGPSLLALAVAEGRQELKSRQRDHQTHHTAQAQQSSKADLVAVVAQRHSGPTSHLLAASEGVHLAKQETQTYSEQHSALVELRVA